MNTRLRSAHKAASKIIKAKTNAKRIKAVRKWADEMRKVLGS